MRRACCKSVQNRLVMFGEQQAHKQPAFGAAVVLADRWLPSKTRFEAASFFGICSYMQACQRCADVLMRYLLWGQQGRR